MVHLVSLVDFSNQEPDFAKYVSSFIYKKYINIYLYVYNYVIDHYIVYNEIQ